MIKAEHLVGIPFEHGKTDCYDIVRRFYKDNYDIELTNYARPDNWWDHGMSLYMDNYKAEGFVAKDISVSDVMVGDLFLMAIRSQVANHAAIYVGDGLILHHFYGRLSTIESYKGLWRNTTVAILRHKKVKAKPEKAKTVDLMSLLPQNRQRRYRSLMNGQPTE